jgi:hypothetical protein
MNRPIRSTQIGERCCAPHHLSPLRSVLQILEEHGAKLWRVQRRNEAKMGWVSWLSPGSASEAHYPARLGSGGTFFVERRSTFVLHFACKLLRFQCDELRCFVLKMLISEG